MTPSRVVNRSPTALLCELTRLKSQQKVFESAESHVNIDCLNELYDNTSVTISIQGKSVIHIFNQIEQTRIQHVQDQTIFLEESQASGNGINFRMKEIKQNLQTQRIHKHSMEAVRQQIVNINKEIEKTKLNNSNKILILQNNTDDLFFQKQI